MAPEFILILLLGNSLLAKENDTIASIVTTEEGTPDVTSRPNTITNLSVANETLANLSVANATFTTKGPTTVSFATERNEKLVEHVSPRFPGDPFAVSPDGRFPASFNEEKDVDACHTTAQCVALENTTCLGVQLPYTHTSLALTRLANQRIAREYLNSWSSLRNIPRCWAVVQPLLCAIFFPRCDNTSKVQLPPKEMCTKTRAPCEIVEKEKVWPEYLKCQDYYQPNCKNSVRELKFNTTGQCAPLLVATDEKSKWYEGVKGCGIQCANPMFTPEEHEDFHKFVVVLGGVCSACAALTVLTYLIDWRAANKYPVLIIFYVNGCFLIASIGFMVQFHPGVRNDLTCRSDGMLRQAEPSSGGNLSCVVVFVCIYYFMMAGGIWLIILAYALHTSFKSYAAGLCGDELERRAAYFHLVSWSLPLVLTITIMLLAEIEGDSLMGICFLSHTLHIRIGFLLLPVIIIVAIGCFFLVQGMMRLVRLKIECSNIISDAANSKIVETIIRLAALTISLVTFTAITIYCHIYQYKNQHLWDKALREYIMCESGMRSDPEDSSVSPSCKIAHRPNINVYKLHLLALFGAGIAMSSWCWTRNTVNAWKRFLRRVAGVSSEEPLRLSKHKVIAQAFAKRHDLNTAGRLSISLHSLHADPIGLNFDMNSATSGDLSSAWATAIPHLMARRGAVVGSAALGLRRNSVDSEFSISRRFSIESGHNNRSSRRHSLDSQMSFHVSDAERLAALHTAARFGRRKRRDWFNLRRSRRANAWDRRGSNTSDDSNLGSMILPAITINQDTLFANMMKRLNISSDDPTRSERGAPSAPSTKSVNVPLPGQTTMESEDEFGTENHAYADNDSVSHAVLRKVLKSVDLKRQDEGYRKNSNERDRLSYSPICACGRIKNGDVSGKINKSSVGIQTSLTECSSSKVIMVSKSVQVSSPMLTRASHGCQTNSLSNSNSSVDHSHRTHEGSKKITETSFTNQRKSQNGERPGTPMTKLTKKPNASGEKTRASSNKNSNNSYGSHKRNTSAKCASGHGRRRRSREASDIMTVIDIGEVSD
ncbi:protein smoothened isoform X2 [Palaemon carinicauda]|uniref:protein smoothened isoform X2 n=1 Tax=Palaemon carinicauda TaxID=392227 RepID=UPI0035B59997